MNRFNPAVCLLTVSLVLLFASNAAYGQDQLIKGRVTDAITAKVLPATEVLLIDEEGNLVTSTETDSRGRFRFSSLASGSFTLVFQREFYDRLRITGVESRRPDGPDVLARLVQWFVMGDTLIVSASRHEETTIRAPVSVSTIPMIDLQEQPNFSPVDLAKDVTGVDFANKGLNQSTYSVRGARGVTSRYLLVLADNRYTAMPVLNYNIAYSMSQASEDIERIEIVRGPGAAIYGPNATQGVLHVITRSPFESQGTSLSLLGGERDVLQGTLRHAGTAGESFGYKISGQYYTGHDWEYYDPKEEENRQKAIDAGADPDTLLVGKRDFNIEQARGDLRLDWRLGENSLLNLNSGLGFTGSTIDLISTTGAIQVQDWWQAFMQGRYSYKRFNANLTYNIHDTEDTYILRSGAPVRDNSRILAAQLQQSNGIADRVEIMFGADYRYSDPRTEGTIHGRYEDDDMMNELGGYFTSTTRLDDNLDLVAALRVDYHDRINDVAVSPRAGFVYEPRKGQALRITYNRAYDSPDAADLFMDMKMFTMIPGMMDMRLVSVPKEGWSWTRDCSGQYCMRSPFHPDGASATMVADATLMWPAVVNALQGILPAIADVPPPDGSQVGSDLRSLDFASNTITIPVENIPDLEQMKRNYITTVEAGYKGSFGDRVRLATDVYWNELDDFSNTLIGATPNVFFNQADLQDYLIDTGGFDPATAAFVADTVSSIPVGTVAPDGVESADVILAYRQEGNFITNYWGVDIGTEFDITSKVSLDVTYSWISEEIRGAPRNKGSAGISYRDHRLGLDGGVRYRAVEQFYVASGVYHGTVESYDIMDISLGYRLPVGSDVRLSVNAYNVFNNLHQEMYGSPDLGRLVVARVQYNF